MKTQNNVDVLKDLEALNLYDDITLEDIDLIEQNLSTNVQINPPDDLAESIINCVMPLMHENDAFNSQCPDNKVFFLLRQVKNQILILGKAFYISVALILASSLLLNTYGYFNQIFVFSPLIVLFQVLYSYRGVYYNVYEMELCCKYSTFEITLSRTIIILAINVILSFIIGILNIFMGLQLPFFYVLITWLTPMIVTYYVTLYFLINKNLEFSIISGSSAWISYVVLYTRFIGEGLIYNKTIFNINLSVMVLALILISSLLINTKKQYSS
ncbi:MAG: hypothetical protein ACREV6_14425 [Clostridium sp.]|uniref:hypothetical protein n=1 Tax=Clostridium sp. TaxID=1506 RepID=UPI003D6CC97C